jgi:hypothetical protein
VAETAKKMPGAVRAVTRAVAQAYRDFGCVGPCVTFWHDARGPVDGPDVPEAVLALGWDAVRSWAADKILRLGADVVVYCWQGRYLRSEGVTKEQAKLLFEAGQGQPVLLVHYEYIPPGYLRRELALHVPRTQTWASEVEGGKPTPWKRVNHPYWAGTHADCLRIVLSG